MWHNGPSIFDSQIYVPEPQPPGPHVYRWSLSEIPRYIGKAARPGRYRDHLFRVGYFAGHLLAALERGERARVDFMRFDSEAEADAYERFCIVYYGRLGIDFAAPSLLPGDGRERDGILYNRTVGGGATLAAGRKAAATVRAKRLRAVEARAKATLFP